MRSKFDTFPIPNGSNIVIYHRQKRTAYFYHKSASGYTLQLVRNKRAKPIRVRHNDYLLSEDFDGTIIPGDAFGVFERVSDERKR